MSDTSGTLPRLTAAETAARLGVKPETLYAYVSRGLLTRVRDRRGSTFDPLEVETFAARRRSAPADRSGRPTGAPLGTIEVDLALIEDDELYYRGRRAAELADQGFERVCRWVWAAASGGGGADEPRDEPADGEPVDGGPVDGGRAGEELTPFVAGPLPPLPPPSVVPGALDRIHLQVVGAGAADPLRNDLAPVGVVRRAGPLLAAEVEALPLRGSEPAPGASMAARLWPRLTEQAPAEDAVALLDAALVLLLDHDLAASTLAVRVAASARAHPYAAVAAGLGALDSALHGDASRTAYAVLARVVAGEPAPRVLAETVRAGGLAGFGHRIYRRRDPRAEDLLTRLERLAEADPGSTVAAAVAGYRALAAAVGRADPRWFPNVDLALAALALAFGMAPDAGTAVFAIGRTAGWLAHALAEYREPPLRLRPVGRYRGP
ncbi:citrate synthase [Friedmanniella endophytica]|uniref:citrate synthase (unknown stereospecificity) n=1 Tax=Microlunatus kandeliicorticis TaxID=1759536 RepID=A0A7W3IQ20_9ACTN|nr:citrate synthase [Microlunatus kandeliicorticis]MBA8793136.1 citrate synthase [Microlunatus kandeliicorticis]